MALVFAVSGVVAVAGRVKPLHDRLRSELSKRLRLPNHRVHFIGNPFVGNDRLVLPLQWGDVEKKKHPTTRLLRCWTRLNEFCDKQLLPLLADPDAIIICKRFGLDALLYATGDLEQEDGNEKAEELHHEHLVPMRISAQNIKPPIYLIPRANPETAYEDLCLVFPGLCEKVGEETVQAFIKHERDVMNRYFAPGRGQSVRYLVPTKDIDGPFEQAVGYIESEITRLAQAA